MSRIRTRVRVGAEDVELDVYASFAYGIDVTDEAMVSAALAVNHPLLLDLVRAELRVRGVDLDHRSVEILGARHVEHDARPPRPALSVVPEGWTVTEVEVRETTTYTVTVAHPTGATPDEVAAVGYDDYCQAMQPQFVFPHTVSPDEITVAGEIHEPGDGDDTTPRPSWAEHRPAVTTRREASAPSTE